MGGRRDLNPRQPDPQSGALTRLSYDHQPTRARLIFFSHSVKLRAGRGIKLQIPNSRLPRSTKSQTPNTKLQARSAGRGLELGTWDFFGVWSLVFGVSIPELLWSLRLGAWCFAQRRPKNCDAPSVREAIT